jgi:polyhydroxyalkanoate synthesis regulator phasin
MDYEERIKQEIEAMKAKRTFVEQTTDINALQGTIDELCALL